MNKIFLHLWLFTLGSSILHSCTQNEAVPDVESQDQENEITFQTNENASRAFIDGNLSTDGTTIKIYGYHDGNLLAANKPGKELNGKSLTYQDGKWSVMNDEGTPLTYFWEGNGTYRFFGWLTNDEANGIEIPDDLKLTYADSQLSIPETVIDKDYSQFDFLYSEINHRKMTDENFNREKGQPVSMDMNHLFTAFAIGIRNTSEDDIVIKSVTLNCVHDEGSVNIDFSENATANGPTESASSVPSIAHYGQTSKSDANAPFNSYSGSYTLTSGSNLPNIFSPADIDQKYYMVWPQTGVVLNATGISLGEDDEEEDETEANERDANSPLLLEYTVDGVPFKKRLRLPNENWLPGMKYYLEVLIADKLVEITTTVRDWDYTDAKVDFSDNSILVEEGGHLQWDETKCIVDHTKKEVYVKGGMPVEGTFTINAPQGGQWRVSLEGDVTAFRIVDDATPTDDGFGPIDGEVHRIKIVPQITTPDRDYRVTLKFVAITADHKTYPADDMLQDSDGDDEADIYTVVLEKVK